MLLYKREIEGKSTSLKILLFIIIAIGLFALYYDFTNLTYFIAVAFSFLSLITLTNLTITANDICISKIYFWGLIRINTHFEPPNLLFIPHGYSNFGDNADTDTIFDGGEGEGLILGCLFSTMFSQKVVYRRFTFREKKESNNKSIEIMIDQKEYIAIKEILPKSSNH